MKEINKVFEIANNLWIDPEQASEIIKQNQISGYEYSPIARFLFVSGANIFSNPLFLEKGNSPGQRGDCGVYWTTNKGKTLALASFNIDPNENELRICQIQGNRVEYLTTREQKKALKLLPWEQSLIQVIEDLGKQCNVKKIKVISTQRLLEERAKQGFSQTLDPKAMYLRYDVPAIYRGFFPSEDGDYVKNI